MRGRNFKGEQLNPVREGYTGLFTSYYRRKLKKLRANSEKFK